MATGTSCPKCGGTDVVPIEYGMPGPDLVDAEERGEVVLGGCCLPLGPDGELTVPDRSCRACGAAFSAGAGRRLSEPPLEQSPWSVPVPRASTTRLTTQRRAISLDPATYGQVIEPRQPKRAGTLRLRPRRDQ